VDCQKHQVGAIAQIPEYAIPIAAQAIQGSDPKRTVIIEMQG
jgi:hypothetical protein